MAGPTKTIRTRYALERENQFKRVETAKDNALQHEIRSQDPVCLVGCSRHAEVHGIVMDNVHMVAVRAAALCRYVDTLPPEG